MRIGIIGCGNISTIYLKNLPTFEGLSVVGCADILPERAQAQADAHNVPWAGSVEDLLARPDVDLVVNLTIPAVHAAVSRMALEAGKHVYSEKPLAISRVDGRALVALAEERGLRIGGAPDTFLGGGLQTCRKLIDDGVIGQPVAATAFMMSHGPETWHPDPAFFYEAGAGPLFDMGPYYITALVNLLGGVRRVSAAARISFPERVITSQPHVGEVIRVKTPTHVVANIDMAGGALATMITSFDVWGSQVPRIEIYGSEATLGVPDPNTFGGPVLLRKAGEKTFSELPLTYGYTVNSRGLGVADMADAIRSGRPARASGDLTFHVLDTMQTILDAADAGGWLETSSTVERPAALPVGVAPGRIAV
ncbi:MAG: Gfo/Idh/MocA family oxidoreductase [Anaerolineae bacterium]